MPNANYIKGRRKEYKVCDELKECGFEIVQRTAGSHSPIDIIAIDIETHQILFVQCKPDGYKETKYDAYKSRLAGFFKVHFQVR